MPEPKLVQKKNQAFRVLADALTASRLVFAAMLVAIGLNQRQEGLRLAVALFVLGWTADTFDGHLGERSGYIGTTLLSRNDVAVDVAFSLGGLSYFVIAGFVPFLAGLVYVALAGAVYAAFPLRSVLVALQAPVTAIPLVVSLLKAPTLALLLAVWALALLAVDFRRFRWRLARFVEGLPAGIRPRR